MEIERTRHNSTAMGDEVPPPMELDVSPMRSILQPNRSDDREQDDQDDLPSNSDNVERPIPDVTFDVTGREFQGPTALDNSLPDRLAATVTPIRKGLRPASDSTGGTPSATRR
jgi:hypothetical protein